MRPNLAAVRPVGFTLLGLFIGWVTFLGILAEFFEGVPATGADAVAGLARLVQLGMAAITVEALWMCRPWAFRASAWLAVSSVVASLAARLTAGDVDAGFSLATVLVWSVILVIPLRYVYVRTASLHPTRRTVAP